MVNKSGVGKTGILSNLTEGNYTPPSYHLCSLILKQPLLKEVQIRNYGKACTRRICISVVGRGSTGRGSGG